ncbi:MAG: TetR/AcrR family transcriptional regulator [Deltaproteobacteria bacterium]|nr:TetR/AcrR family transcriptional regulator [Deltaproteobacteria bacterium]
MRRRLPADESKQRILEAAERRLREGGPNAVRMREVARDLGITDAAVAHHFRNRAGLLDALARFGARRLRAAVEEAVGSTKAAAPDIHHLAALALDTFERRGYSRLLLWLTISGLRVDRGSGMFADLARAVERAREDACRQAGRKPPAPNDTRFLAALFVMTLFAEPLIGEASRRSVGLPGNRATTRRFRAWLAETIAALVSESQLPSTRRPGKAPLLRLRRRHAAAVR